MTEREDFLAWVGSTLRDAEVAVHDGDPEPRRAIWSRTEPVTVLGAWRNAFGLTEVDALFDLLGASFGGTASYRHEVVAAEVVGDLAYTVGFEHTSAVVNGEPREYVLRVTQVYRREDGHWKVINRHGDEELDADRGP